MRVLGWIVAIGLTAYGSVVTVVGLLVSGSRPNRSKSASSVASRMSFFTRRLS